MKKGTLVFAAVLLCLFGCAAREPAGQEPSPTATKDAPNVVFYTFPDIPVPYELKLVREKSFVYETPSFKAGVLVFKGNVDIPSLETYFRTNMARNGWRFVNSYKYRDVILNFVKEDRTSAIRTWRETFNTHVEIWVGPVDRFQPPVPAHREMPAPRENEFR